MSEYLVSSLVVFRRTCFARSSVVAICSFALLSLGLVSFVSMQQSLWAEEFDPEQPYTASRSQPVTYDVDFSIVVTPPYKTKKLQVWLPIPPSDTAQEVTESKLSSFPMSIQPQLESEPLFGNRFAYFEFDSPQGAQIIRHQFSVKVWQLDWNLDPTKVVLAKQWPESFSRYRRSESQAVVVDDRFRDLLQEIVPQPGSPSGNLGKVFSWVQNHFQYDHHDASLSASSVHALAKQGGHCSDYHGFCASLGRALGVPTRVTYGINPFPKNSPSHCKLEAYLPPYGWISFDVSETQKLVQKIRESGTLDESEKTRLITHAQQRLERGFRDNTWFLQTRGTDYDLAPPASKRVAVVRTAYIEADGVPLAEPDPADKTQDKFAWMTVHKYQADKEVLYPFADWQSLSITNKQ